MKKAAIILTLMLTFLGRSSYSIQESAKDSSETRTYFPQYYGEKTGDFCWDSTPKDHFMPAIPLNSMASESVLNTREFIDLIFVTTIECD